MAKTYIPKNTDNLNFYQRMQLEKYGNILVEHVNFFDRGGDSTATDFDCHIDEDHVNNLEIT